MSEFNPSYVGGIVIKGNSNEVVSYNYVVSELEVDTLQPEIGIFVDLSTSGARTILTGTVGSAITKAVGITGASRLNADKDAGFVDLTTRAEAVVVRFKAGGDINGGVFNTGDAVTFEESTGLVFNNILNTVTTNWIVVESSVDRSDVDSTGTVVPTIVVGFLG